MYLMFIILLLTIMSFITISKGFGMRTFGMYTSLSTISTSTTTSTLLRMMSTQPSGPKVYDLDVQKFNKILNENRSSFQILDVREPNELDVVKLPFSDVINLPLSTAGEWSGKIETGMMLDPTKPTICLCHHGIISLSSLKLLSLTLSLHYH